MGSWQLPYSQTLEKAENTCYAQARKKSFTTLTLVGDFINILHKAVP
jgi:hypothetical protein